MRCVRMAWAGTDLIGISLGSLWGTQMGRCPLLTPQLFAAYLFPVNAKLVYTFVQVLCSFAVIHWDPSYFSIWAAPACISNREHGQEQFYNLLKRGQCSSELLSSTHTSACGPPVLTPSPRCSHASPIPDITACLAVGSLVGLGMCEPGRALGEGAVYYLLPLATNTRVPILTAAVRLPGVQNQHLLKQSLGFYFHRKCS